MFLTMLADFAQMGRDLTSECIRAVVTRKKGGDVSEKRTKRLTSAVLYGATSQCKRGSGATKRKRRAQGSPAGEFSRSGLPW